MPRYRMSVRAELMFDVDAENEQEALALAPQELEDSLNEYDGLHVNSGDLPFPMVYPTVDEADRYKIEIVDAWEL